MLKWKGTPAASEGGIIVSSLVPAPATNSEDLAVRVSGQKSLRRFLASTPQLWIGGVLILFIAAFCFLGPLFWTRNPFNAHISIDLQPPSSAHPFGTDILGRDELARVMLGGQMLIIVSLVAAAATTIVGTVAGLVAGWWGGPLDAGLTWLGDVVFGIPQLVPLVLFMDILSPNGYTMAIVIAGSGWPAIARLVRAMTLSVREREYIMAAKALGASDARVVLRHVLWNVWTTVIVSGGLQVGNALILVAVAGYLGVGLPPGLPTWGQMIADTTLYILPGYWWLVVPAGAAFALLQIGVNLAAEGLRQIMMRDPRMGGS